MNLGLKLETELKETTLQRWLLLADPMTKKDLADLDLSRVKVEPDGLRMECDLQRVLKKVDGLLPPTRYFFDSDRIVLCNPGFRPVEVTVPVDAPTPTPGMDSLEVQHELSQVTVAYNRCKAALRLSAYQIIICDRQHYLESNLTLDGFGVDARDATGHAIGEVPEVDWLVEELAPLCYQKPGKRMVKEFTHSPLPGVTCRFRAEAQATGQELMIALENLTPQPWLSRD
jgi:hypothetical protein